jgi:hypothetical protein
LVPESSISGTVVEADTTVVVASYKDEIPVTRFF